MALERLEDEWGRFGWVCLGGVMLSGCVLDYDALRRGTGLDAGPDTGLDAAVDAARADGGNTPGDAGVDGASHDDATDAVPLDVAVPFDAPETDADEMGSDAFGSDAFAFDAFAPDAFAFDAFAPDAFAFDAIAPDAFAFDAFAPDAFAPDAFAPDARMTPDASFDAQFPDGGVISACTPPSSRPVGDSEWARYPLPGTPAASRRYVTVGSTVIDCVTGLEWQQTSPATNYDQAGAIANCEGLVLGGYDDWRLPSRIELQSLLDYTVVPGVGPTIDTLAFPGTLNTSFWTSSTAHDVAGFGWIVGFYDASVYYNVTSSMCRARCVR